MTRDHAQMLTRNGLPGPWQCEDVKVVQLVNQLLSLFGGEISIGFDDHLSRPDGRLELLQDFARQDVLMPFDFGIQNADCQGGAKVSPLRNQQQHAVTEDLRLELSHPGGESERLFLSGLLSASGVKDQMQHAIPGRRRRVKDVGAHQVEQRLFVPNFGADHPQCRPVGE